MHLLFSLRIDFPHSSYFENNIYEELLLNERNMEMHLYAHGKSRLDGRMEEVAQ
jgi:hypothetical protein